MQRLKSWRAFLPGAIGFVVLLVALIVGIRLIGVDRLHAFIEDAGPFAPLAYIAIKILTYVVAPLSSGPIQILAGVLFGLIPATIYTLLAEVIGGSINFWLARRFGRPVVTRLVGDQMPRVEQFISQIVDWKTVLYAKLFLFSVYDFISYAIGFSSFPFRSYLIISTVGGIPSTFFASLVGAMLATDQQSVLLIYGVVAVASVIPLVFQKRIRHWLKLDRPDAQPIP